MKESGWLSFASSKPVLKAGLLGGVGLAGVPLAFEFVFTLSLPTTRDLTWFALTAAALIPIVVILISTLIYVVLYLERKYPEYFSEEIYRLEDFGASESEIEPVDYIGRYLFNTFAISDVLMRALWPSAVAAYAIALLVPRIDNPWIVVVLALPLIVLVTLIAMGTFAVVPWFYSAFRIRCAKCGNRIIGAKIRPRPEYRSGRSRLAIARYFWPDQIADQKFTCPNCCAVNAVVKNTS